MYYAHNKQVIAFFSVCGLINYMFWSTHVYQLSTCCSPHHFRGWSRLHCIWYLPHFLQTKGQVIYYVSLHSSDETILRRVFSLHFLAHHIPYKCLIYLLIFLHHVFHQHISISYIEHKLICVHFSWNFWYFFLNFSNTIFWNNGYKASHCL